MPFFSYEMGDIRVNRSLFESDLWAHRPFSRGQAWVDLIGMANWKNNGVVIKGEIFDLKRGQLVGSYRFLAKRWGWGAKRVSNLCQTLKRQQRISLSTQHQTTIITICKYDVYQTPLKYQETVKTKEQATVRQQWGNSEATKQRTEEEQKKNKSKGRQPSDPRIKELLTYWNTKYKTLTGKPYLFNYGKDGSLLKRVLATYEKEEVLDLIDRFYGEAKKEKCWWRENTTIGTFYSVVPKLIRQLTRRS